MVFSNLFLKRKVSLKKILFLLLFLAAMQLSLSCSRSNKESSLHPILVPKRVENTPEGLRVHQEFVNVESKNGRVYLNPIGLIPYLQEKVHLKDLKRFKYLFGYPKDLSLDDLDTWRNTYICQLIFDIMAYQFYIDPDIHIIMRSLATTVDDYKLRDAWHRFQGRPNPPKREEFLIDPDMLIIMKSVVDNYNAWHRFQGRPNPPKREEFLSLINQLEKLDKTHLDWGSVFRQLDQCIIEESDLSPIYYIFWNTVSTKNTLLNKLRMFMKMYLGMSQEEINTTIPFRYKAGELAGKAVPVLVLITATVVLIILCKKHFFS